MSGEKYINLMNQSIKGLFRDALSISLKNPLSAFYFLRFFLRQFKAISIRKYWDKNGVHVPPFMIMSITHRCNLNCKGCYAMNNHKTGSNEMSLDKIKKTVKEAKDLGVSIILLAGGEPLYRMDILDVAEDFPEIIFPLFTNGLMINDRLIQKMKRLKNLVPVLSLEGYKHETDERRGKGVYEHIFNIMKKMGKENIFFGVSITINKDNYSLTSDNTFIRELIQMGCRLFFFVEYVPVQEGTDDMILTEGQRNNINALMNKLRHQYPGLFLAFPGDEEAFGGCLSAGRGFIHVSPEGNLEPCPFAPYSDTNLENTTLKEGLKSSFLNKIRQNHSELNETKDGCALWQKREWVKSLL